MIHSVPTRGTRSGRAKRLRPAALCALIFSLSSTSCGPGLATITIDPSARHQVMTGWEVTARLWEMDKHNDRYDPSWLDFEDELFDRLVDEVGIDRVRIEIRSGSENPVDYWQRFVAGEIGYRELKSHFYEKINDNDDPSVVNPSGFQFSNLDYQVDRILLPLKERVEANGERITVNLCYIDFKWTELKGDLEHALHPTEYSELILLTFERLRDKYGIVPDALEIILEPDNSDEWRGRRIGEAMVAVVPILNRGGFFPRLIAPSTATMSAAPEYFDEMIEVPGVRSLQPTFSYHRYGAFGGPEAVAAIRERAVAHGLTTAMLEHVKGDVEELFADLSLGHATAWQQYAIATTTDAAGDSGGYYYVVDKEKSGPEAVQLGSRSHGLARTFRPVRTGATRIGAHSDDDSRAPVAFVNPDGTHVLVVKASRRGPISIDGLPAGTYRLRHSPESGAAPELPDVRKRPSGPLLLELESPGVLSLVQLGEGAEAAAFEGNSEGTQGEPDAR